MLWALSNILFALQKIIEMWKCLHYAHSDAFKFARIIYLNYENSLHIRCSSLPSSLPPLCIVMFYHPPIFSLIGSLFTAPGHTERDNSPSPAFSWTTNRAFRVQNGHNILKCNNNYNHNSVGMKAPTDLWFDFASHESPWKQDLYVNSMCHD